MILILLIIFNFVIMCSLMAIWNVLDEIRKGLKNEKQKGKNT